jgi:hypothetical protein
LERPMINARARPRNETPETAMRQGELARIHVQVWTSK